MEKNSSDKKIQKALLDNKQELEKVKKITGDDKKLQALYDFIDKYEISYPKLDKIKSALE